MSVSLIDIPPPGDELGMAGPVGPVWLYVTVSVVIEGWVKGPVMEPLIDPP